MSDKVFTSLYPLDFSDYEIYDNVRESIENYYYRRLEPGSFVYAMLCNDFVDAVLKADYWNAQQMKDNALWLANRMPPGAWGSKEIVDEWLKGDNNAT